MLTDIFANRYAGLTLWLHFEERDRRFLVQAFRIISEQLYPYYKSDGEENPQTKQKWQILHDKLSTELGLHELSDLTFDYSTTTWQGNTRKIVSSHTLETVCKNFVCAAYDGSVDSDIFMKERISFIEIAFRERAKDIEVLNSAFREEVSRPRPVPHQPVGARGIRLPGDRVESLKYMNDRANSLFGNAVDELNARIRQAGYGLNYHNGFIQRSTDPVAVDQIETPFWSLVSDGMWKNVDHDMKEAIDLRDSSGRDPALYAARALESAIKIISDQKGWSHGREKGAHNYIDNLGSKKAGKFIADWENVTLKHFFTHIRNPLGHGPGNEDMPALGMQQTDWAIEFCMSWIKSLIRRLQ